MQTFYYPRRNRIGIKPVFEPRQLRIIKRIDLMQDPLTAEQYLRRPLVRRGRWVLLAYDYAAQQYRSFYECSFADTFCEPSLKIGYRDHGNQIMPVDLAYKATVSDRRLLARLLHRQRTKKFVIYADGSILNG